MQRFATTAGALALFSILSIAVSGSANASALDPNAAALSFDESVPGEVLFQLTPGAFASPEYRADLGTLGRTGLAPVDQELSDLGVREIEPVFDLTVNLAAKRANGLDRIFRATFDSNVTPDQAAAVLGSLADIQYAETNGICHTMVAPNDTYYDNQWGHNNHGQASRYGGGTVGTNDCDTDSDSAWDLQTGSPSIVVAVIDTGCDPNHPEYSSRIVPGYDFVNNDSNPADDGNHGTSCAGILLAQGNNGQGVAGLAWGVKLMPVKVLDSGGSGSWDGVANGIVFACDNGARILSLSLGGGANGTVENAVNYAYGEGCALFCASGNDGGSQMIYPARYTNTIAVGAMSPCCERKTTSSCDGENWWGSNYGSGLDFLAPGVRIYTTDRLGGAGYQSGDYMFTFNGTSSATPHAAGIGALVLSENPSLTNDELRAALQNTCDDLGSTGYDSQTGYGRLNAYAAVLEVQTQADGACCHIDGSCSITLENGCASGVWAPTSCDPNPCAQPTRACCLLTGCEVLPRSECVNSGGIWKALASDCDPDPCFVADVPDGVSGVPAQTRLYSSSPNPFRGESILHYGLAEATEVTVRVYSVSGQVVKTILDGSYQSAGDHQVTWDGTNQSGVEVAAGKYVYYFEAGGVSESRSVAFTK